MANLHRLLSEQHFDSPEQMQAFLQQMLSQSGGRVPERAPRSALDEAQDVMYDAWDARGRRRVERRGRHSTTGYVLAGREVRTGLCRR
jgi:hypothetical protein